jgi:ferric iron reductase protein FhuF
MLAETLAALDPPGRWFTHVAGDPSGDAWVGVAAIVADPSIVERWLDDLLAGQARGHRDVAASYLAGWFSGSIGEPVAAAIDLHRCAWPVTADNLAVRRHRDGWFDGLAVLGPDLLVVPDDDVAQLRAQVADELVALLTPIYAVMRAWAPYGSFGMWGSLADGLASGAMQRAKEDGRDGLAAWQEANLLIDALAARVPKLRVRPVLQRVPWSGGVSHQSVRGTCCLYYKVSGQPRDPFGESYCTSCPLRDEGDRCRRWATWLDEQASHEPEPAS